MYSACVLAYLRFTYIGVWQKLSPVVLVSFSFAGPTFFYFQQQKIRILGDI